MRKSFSRTLLFFVKIFAIALCASMMYASDVTTPSALPYTTSVVAGSLPLQPYGVAVDKAGNIYIGESALSGTNGSAVVRKVDAVTGAMTVFAGGVAKAAAGSSTCASPVLTVPGGGNVAGDGCPAGGMNHFFGGVRGLSTWTDPNTLVEYLYVSDSSGNYIHRINLTTNIMEWVGGTGASGYNGDGPIATQKFIKNPYGVAIDVHGNVYFGDGGSSGQAVRMISNDATTCANAISGNFTAPCILTVVNYVSQAAAGVAGCQTGAFLTVANAKNAKVTLPYGLAFDANGDLYFVDKGCFTVRKLIKNSLTGIVDGNSQFTTFMGTGATGSNGPSWYDTNAAGVYPGAVRSIQSAGGNNMYISTTSSIFFYDAATGWAHNIWGRSADGLTCTVNTTSPYIGCPAPYATFAGSSGGCHMAVDAAGSLYVADYGTFQISKASIGTDFIGSAPQFTATAPVTQSVLVHGQNPLPTPTAAGTVQCRRPSVHVLHLDW